MGLVAAAVAAVGLRLDAGKGEEGAPPVAGNAGSVPTKVAKGTPLCDCATGADNGEWCRGRGGLGGGVGCEESAVAGATRESEPRVDSAGAVVEAAAAAARGGRR